MDRGRVAVVGGGLSGLAAGLALKDAGFSVELFERSRLLGGRATSFEIDGREVDNGQHVFLGACTAFVAFVERVGMGSALAFQERFDVTAFRHGRSSRLRALPLPAPWHVAFSLATYRHLSWRDRLSVGRALIRIAKERENAEPFERWLDRAGQSARARASFWEPFIVPALNLPLARVRTGDAAFVIATAFFGDPRAARFGWSRVPLAHIAQAAAAKLDRVHTSAPVFRIAFDSEGVVLHLEGERGARFEGAVLAVAPPQLARIVEEPRRLGIPLLAGWEPEPIVDVHVWHDRGPLEFEFAALLDSPVQWVFQKDRDYLCCSLSAAGEMADAATDAVIARCWEELRAGVPALRDARLVRGAVTRNPNATYAPSSTTTRPPAHTSDPRIALAGSWLATGWPDTMESAVRSGLDAAEVLARLPLAHGVASA